MDGLRLAAGLLAASAVSAIGYRRRALTPDGAVAAAGVGGLVFAAGGIAWAVPLLFFFVTGSTLTHLRRRREARGDPTGRAAGSDPPVGPSADGEGRVPSGDRAAGGQVPDGALRSARQVLANGGVAALGSLLRLAWGPEPAWDALVVGSLAAMAADTWATEVGLLAGWPTRQVLTGRLVQPGSSGGVSLPGTLAGLGGAMTTAWLASIFAAAPALWLKAGLAGVVGLVADSLLGAFAQVRYQCEVCGQKTEHPRGHRRRCPGARLVRVHGWGWLDNDGVNFVAASLGGLAAVAGLAGGPGGPAATA